MTFDQIIKDINSKKYHPVYFLTGEEPYYIDQIAHLIEQKVLNESEKAFNQLVVYGKDADIRSIVDEARQYPMMSALRVVIVREAQDLKDIQILDKYIANPSSTTIMVLCYKYKKLDKRTALAKTLASNAVFYESKKLYENQVPSWIISYVEQNGYKIASDAAGLMTEYIGADLSKLSNELDKVFINLKDNSIITKDIVREQIGISKEFNVFELQTALGNRNFTKAAVIIRYFIQNPGDNPAVMVVANLFSYFIKVHAVKIHHNTNDAELAKSVGVSPFFIKDYKQAAKNYTVDHLYNILQSIKKADMHSKGIGNRRSNDGGIFKDILISCMHY